MKCRFDYFRKDRRERLYIMEDMSDCMRLMDILQPVVQLSQASRFSTNTYEVNIPVTKGLTCLTRAIYPRV